MSGVLQGFDKASSLKEWCCQPQGKSWKQGQSSIPVESLLGSYGWLRHGINLTAQKEGQVGGGYPINAHPSAASDTW
jgi:hypothetical protein